MTQFYKEDLIVALPGRGYSDKLFRVDMVLENGQICVDFGGVVKLANPADFRLAKAAEVVLFGRRMDDDEDLPEDSELFIGEVEQPACLIGVNLEPDEWNPLNIFFPEDEHPDIIDLPFASGLGAEGTYGMSDEQLAQHQQDCLGRHDRMCRNLIVIALLLVAVIAGMNWWVA